MIKLSRTDPVIVHLREDGLGQIIVGEVDLSGIVSNLTISSGSHMVTRIDGPPEVASRTHEIELELVPLLSSTITIDEGVLRAHMEVIE